MAHRSLVIFKWNYQIILQIHLNTYSDAVICWRFVDRRLERNATGFDALDWWSGPEMSLLIDSATAPTVIESGKKETFFLISPPEGSYKGMFFFPFDYLLRPQRPSLILRITRASDGDILCFVADVSTILTDIQSSGDATTVILAVKWIFIFLLAIFIKFYRKNIALKEVVVVVLFK